MTHNTATRMSWEYIAGFFDGEGHVGLGRQKYCGEGHYSRGSPRVTIVQAHDRGLAVLQRIAEFLCGHSIKSVVEVHQDNGIYAKSYHLRITGFNGVITFLSYVFPYLHVKKTEAQDLVRYAKVFPTLQGMGHKHTENTRKAWETRRRRYGGSGYRIADGLSITEASNV